MKRFLVEFNGGEQIIEAANTYDLHTKIYKIFSDTTGLVYTEIA